MLGDAVSVSPPQLQTLPRRRLLAMRAAGQRVLESYRALEKSGTNVVAEVLRGQGEFYEWDHYPAGDVYDWDTHSQYYYHAHPPERRGSRRYAEHGHFHTFLRPRGFPKNVRPAKVAAPCLPADPNDALSHLIAISMDHAGYPCRLFTTNRWVTGETWYDAPTVSRLVKRFRVDQALPSQTVNDWISSMLVLFGPSIDALLAARDQALAAAAAKNPGANVFEYRGAEVLSAAEISVDGQVAAVEAALAG